MESTDPAINEDATQKDASETQIPDKQKPGRSAPVLPWMRVPLTIQPGDGTLLEDIGGLDPRLISALASSHVGVLFPVQSVVWEATSGGSSSLHDICLAAPTGSGKTLAYSLPVLQALARRPSSALESLIVLPTRDLALQVYSVIAPLCAAIGKTCCAACGKVSLAVEAEALASSSSRQSVNILIATPGRLIAHMEGTPGFTLSSLRYLIVDEADRLLRQTYHNWLPRVLHACSAAANEKSNRVVKFIVSATLTKDPSKLDRLDLVCPRYIAMAADDHRYKLPPGLEEVKLVVPAHKKPYALAALLAELRPSPVVVFTSAVESTKRLALMLKSLSKNLIGEVVEYSAALAPDDRRAALNKFRSKEASVLVCSDAMTRGMDVEGVEVVINYDAPVYVKTYVHRAGRTARAGKSGKVITLLRHEDVRHFKNMLRKADNTYVKDINVEKERAEEVNVAVDDALKVMAETLITLEEGVDPFLNIVSVGDGSTKVKEKRTSASGDDENQNNTSAGKKNNQKKKRKLTGLPEMTLF